MANLNQQHIHSVCANIINMEKGTLIKHEAMAQMFGVSKGTRKYYSLVNCLKNVLKIEHSIFLKTEHKIGYRICRDGEDGKIIISKLFKGLKSIQIAQNDLNYIDDKKYNEHNKKIIERCRTIAETLTPNYGAIIGSMTNLGLKSLE